MRCYVVLRVFSYSLGHNLVRSHDDTLSEPPSHGGRLASLLLLCLLHQHLPLIINLVLLVATQHVLIVSEGSVVICLS